MTDRRHSRKRSSVQSPWSVKSQPQSTAPGVHAITRTTTTTRTETVETTTFAPNTPTTSPQSTGRVVDQYYFPPSQLSGAAPDAYTPYSQSHSQNYNNHPQQRTQQGRLIGFDPQNPFYRIAEAPMPMLAAPPHKEDRGQHRRSQSSVMTRSRHEPAGYYSHQPTHHQFYEGRSQLPATRDPQIPARQGLQFAPYAATEGQWYQPFQGERTQEPQQRVKQEAESCRLRVPRWGRRRTSDSTKDSRRFR